MFESWYTMNKTIYALGFLTECIWVMERYCRNVAVWRTNMAAKLPL